MARSTHSFGAPGLLREWTARTLRGRYQQSWLGWLWDVIQPVAQAMMLAVVFTYIVPIDTGDTPYLLFAFVATVPWAFLSGALTDMTNSLVENMSLVNKIYFPRDVLPVASMLARLADFAVAWVFVLVLAAVLGAPVASAALLALPAILLVQLLLTVGLGLAGAAANVFVRDTRSVLVLVLQLWFYASPVLYPIERVPAGLRSAYVLNPMVGVIEGYRAVLLRGEWPDATLLVAAAVSAVVFLGGYAVFKALEFRFADIV